MTRTITFSALRRWVTTVLIVLGITFGSVALATPASAHPPGNVYNNSDHGMWFRATDRYTGNPNTLKWVPAKTWSSAVGVVATGVYVGKGYCARLSQSNNRGGWGFTVQTRGNGQVLGVNVNYEYLVYEWPC